MPRSPRTAGRRTAGSAGWTTPRCTWSRGPAANLKSRSRTSSVGNVLNITGNAAIDVFIGLAFFYFLLSIFCSAINEGIATAFNLRAKDLEKGIRNLLADNASDFYK